MVDAGPRRSPGTGRDGPYEWTGRDGPYEPTPRWVKALLVVGGLLAVAVLVLLISGGGHGPGRHMGLLAAVAAAL